MKAKPDARGLPAVTKAEIDERLPKLAAIFFRLTKSQKKAIDAAAKSQRLTTADYLIACHEVVSAKLGGK